MKLLFCAALFCITLHSISAHGQTPNLQQVTTEGATTDKDITLYKGLSFGSLSYGLNFLTNGGSRWLIRHEWTESTGNIGSDLAIHSYDDGGNHLRNNLYIKRNSGNIGIGTNNPQSTLDVAGTTTSTIFQIINNAAHIGYIGRGGTITGGWSSTPDVFAITSMRDIALGGWGKSDGLWKGAALYINSDNGNILINQTSQTNTAYKLDVAGNVRANKVVVNTTGADFVFAPEYKLSSLQELEKFILQHRHLPGIQPASEMQQNGLDVGDNQTRLLQKIEELTLYVIDLHKKVTEQQAVIQQQEKSIRALQSAER